MASSFSRLPCCDNSSVDWKSHLTLLKVVVVNSKQGNCRLSHEIKDAKFPGIYSHLVSLRHNFSLFISGNSHRVNVSNFYHKSLNESRKKKIIFSRVKKIR